PDETIRRLLEVQLDLLGYRVAWSGAAPPGETLAGVDVAVVDPGAPGAVEFVRDGEVPCVFVSALEPTRETRALEPRAHLTMPYSLDDRAALLGSRARRPLNGRRR